MPILSPTIPQRSRLPYAALLIAGILCLLIFIVPNNATPVAESGFSITKTQTLLNPIVFVSRQIPHEGSNYYAPAKAMAGVGPHGRFMVAAPGKLLLMNVDSSITTLIDGTQPTSGSLNLIDVSAPAVSYDADWIAFAGLVDGQYSSGPATNPGAWRIYKIRPDGSGLTQLTFDDSLDLSQFGAAAQGLSPVDDTDPCWLPDGRLVFSSTRYRSYAQYSGVRTTNLFVMNADGSDLHRITTEKNGADRPLIDPQTGKIVYARWWRNFRYPSQAMDTQSDSDGLVRKAGLTKYHSQGVGGKHMDRNFWQAASINPDGSQLKLWAGSYRHMEQNHFYGGDFDEWGFFFTNFFPMLNMSEASGFGGIRASWPGPGIPDGVAGVTRIRTDYVHTDPNGNHSFGIYQGEYFADVATLDGHGNLVLSKATDIQQDYGLYQAFSLAVASTEPLYDLPGTAEMRPRVLWQRPLPAVIPDHTNQRASALPPKPGEALDKEGTFTFNCLNVFFNAPVDVPITSAPPVGLAKTMRIYADPQRTQTGSFPEQDWPILVKEVAVSPWGGVFDDEAPANIPLFEQLRSSQGKGYKVPHTGGNYPDGAAHVTGLNYGHPGETVTCVGCHAGHSMIEVPSTLEEVYFTNLAPGAVLSFSSVHDSAFLGSVTDRRVTTNPINTEIWTSKKDSTQNQWVHLAFHSPIWVKSVKLYNPPMGNGMTVQVMKATVRLFSDAAGTQEIARETVNTPISSLGESLDFLKIKARSVRVELDQVQGKLFNMDVASIGEIEVIASAGNPASLPIEEFADQDLNSLVLFPNPASSFIQVKYMLNQPEPRGIRILDLQGKEYQMHRPKYQGPGIQSYSYPITELPRGIYLLVLKGNTRLEVKKFIKK